MNGIIAQQLVRMDMKAKIRWWDENDRGQGKTWEEMEWDIRHPHLTSKSEV